MSVITARKRKERYETLNKAKFISLISTAVLATASAGVGVFADETPVSDGSTSPTVSVTPTVPTDKVPDTSASHVSDGTSGVTAPTTPVTPAPSTTPKSEEKPSTSETVTPTVPTDKVPDTSASHVSDGTSGVTAPTTPVTPTPPTTPKSEEKPSTSKKKSKTTASNSQIPDPNKVTDKAPEAKLSTDKQAVAAETEALPHTGDDTVLTVSLTSLGAFLIAAGLGFLPKRKKD